ncbi:MAG TPA: sucrase ferredoxin [Gaiellaceae bacterium]|nr:sucrase ferredoxin [Gaiellaceae bacterium]
MTTARPFCSDISRENDEPLGATASRIDHWLLVEYRGLWSSDALVGSGLSDQVKTRLRELRSARPRTRLLFIRRPDRRRHPKLAVYVATSRQGEERIGRLELDEHEDLRRVDPWEAAEDTDELLFLACTHGKHDPCCARYGRPLYEALSEELDPESAWQCTHVGGDRFAGNALCLPHGVYYGRVDRDDVPGLVDEYFDGRISLAHYRGRSCWPFAVQAAERRIRAEEGLTGLDDLRLSRVDARGAIRWTVAFETRVGPREVDVVTELGELTMLTCNADRVKRPLRYVAMPR